MSMSVKIIFKIIKNINLKPPADECNVNTINKIIILKNLVL